MILNVNDEYIKNQMEKLTRAVIRDVNKHCIFLSPEQRNALIEVVVGTTDACLRKMAGRLGLFQRLLYWRVLNRKEVRKVLDEDMRDRFGKAIEMEEMTDSIAESADRFVSKSMRPKGI